MGVNHDDEKRLLPVLLILPVGGACACACAYTCVCVCVCACACITSACPRWGCGGGGGGDRALDGFTFCLCLLAK